MKQKKILFFANTDWYLYNFRLALARELRRKGNEVVLVSPPGPYGKKLCDEGFVWLPFNFSVRSMNPFKELGVIRQLIALYRREKPGLCHHFTIKCVLYGSIAAYFSGKTPVVNAVTGLGHIFTDNGFKTLLLRPIVRKLYRFIFSLNARNMRVIFQNAEDRAFFIRAGMVPESHTRLIRGSGVNCEQFHPGDGQRDGGPVQILFASRMLKEKGIRELIEAAAILKEKGITAKFVIAGEAYPENPSSLTEREIERIKDAGDVNYVGHVDDMPTLIRKSDIVVLPSYREGTPKILIEAAAMGKPIIATDIAGCADLVRHNVNGFLVPVRDAQALSDALLTLISDSGLRESFGRMGREIVLNEFAEDIVISKTMEIYRELSF
jgi:glycosyltransferase involved in cell wall biosynthesis